jgi:hypothetical protein
MPRVRLYDGPMLSETLDAGFHRIDVLTADWKPPSLLRWKRGLTFSTTRRRESVFTLAENTSPAGRTPSGPPRISRSS